MAPNHIQHWIGLNEINKVPIDLINASWRPGCFLSKAGGRYFPGEQHQLSVRDNYRVVRNRDLPGVTPRLPARPNDAPALPR